MVDSTPVNADKSGSNGVFDFTDDQDELAVSVSDNLSNAGS